MDSIQPGHVVRSLRIVATRSDSPEERLVGRTKAGSRGAAAGKEGERLEPHFHLSTLKLSGVSYLTHY